MPLTLHERRSVTRELAARYACASRKEKSQLIVQLTELASYARSHAARVLRKPPGSGRQEDVPKSVQFEVAAPDLSG